MDDAFKLEITGEIISSYVSNNPVSAADLPELLQNVATAVERLGDDPEQAQHSEEFTPFTTARKSIKPDHLVCLQCGKKFKTLKRHVRTSQGLTVAEYKERFNLRSDYPIVAPAYSEARTKIALDLGLGRKTGEITKEI